jgi:serine/threonine protein kinase
MSSTYTSPENDFMVNARGLRDKDGAYLSNQINPLDLIVLEELGRGSSAIVKRAINRSNSGFQYVVKCFNMYEKSKRRMLREELKLLSLMACPSVVAFYGAYLDHEHKVCLILEFVDRGSFEDLIVFIRKKKFEVPERVLCAMTFQIVHGLAYLNQEGLMHRDIKPPNLLLSSTGEVKVTDFGIGRRLSEAHSGLSGAATSQDEEGDGMASTFVGTRSYMSLERLLGGVILMVLKSQPGSYKQSLPLRPPPVGPAAASRRGGRDAGSAAGNVVEGVSRAAAMSRLDPGRRSRHSGRPRRPLGRRLVPRPSRPRRGPQ